MTNSFEKAVIDIATQVMTDVATKLSAKYGFDPQEAVEFLNSKIDIERPDIDKKYMPWCGKVRESCCKNIIPNGGLFTQCFSCVEDGVEFCGKCVKSRAKNESKNGDVDMRGEVDSMEYVQGGRHVVPYTVIMKKKGYTREQVEKALQAYGMTIDPRNWVEVVKKGGRPPTIVRKMTVSVPQDGDSDTEKEEEEVRTMPQDGDSEKEEEEVVRPPTIIHKMSAKTRSDSDEEAEEEEEVVRPPTIIRKMSAKTRSDSDEEEGLYNTDEETDEVLMTELSIKKMKVSELRSLASLNDVPIQVQLKKVPVNDLRVALIKLLHASRLGGQLQQKFVFCN